MKRTLNQALCCIGVACLVSFTSASLAAQEHEDHRFTANVGAGFTIPAYTTGLRHDNGWNIGAGAGVNMFTSHLGLMGEFMYPRTIFSYVFSLVYNPVFSCDCGVTGVVTGAVWKWANMSRSMLACLPFDHLP